MGPWLRDHLRPLWRNFLEWQNRRRPGDPAVPPEATVATAQVPAGPCRMCSFPIDAGQDYVVIKIGRRVHDGACADQARAAGYL